VRIFGFRLLELRSRVMLEAAGHGAMFSAISRLDSRGRFYLHDDLTNDASGRYAGILFP